MASIARKMLMEIITYKQVFHVIDETKRYENGPTHVLLSTDNEMKPILSETLTLI